MKYNNRNINKQLISFSNYKNKKWNQNIFRYFIEEDKFRYQKKLNDIFYQLYIR